MSESHCTHSFYVTEAQRGTRRMNISRNQKARKSVSRRSLSEDRIPGNGGESGDTEGNEDGRQEFVEIRGYFRDSDWNKMSQYQKEQSLNVFQNYNMMCQLSKLFEGA